MWQTFLFGFLFIRLANSSPNYRAQPRSTLCVKNNALCDSEGTCSMTYYPINSSLCSELTYDNDKVAVNSLALGNLRLDSYLYEDRTYSQTAFNITFTNITWTDMRFRIMQNGFKGKNTCRQFSRLSNSSTVSIAYDCLWSDESYEGKTFVLDYEARLNDSVVETSRILFNVPRTLFPLQEPKLDELPVLTYVETLPTHFGRTIFNVYWPPMEIEDGTVVDCYRVYVFYNGSGEDTIMHSNDVCNCEPDLCTYSTQMWFGVIRFGVQPLFENNIGGLITKTQYYDIGGETARPLLLGVVACSILVPIVLYMLLYLRNYISSRVLRKTPPKVLVIYSPTTTSHLHMVESFVHYLNTHCQVEAVMDELDIPNSLSKDPFIWCAEAVQSADVICVIASPFFSRLRTSAALYRTDRLLLRLLRENFSSGGKTRYCVLLPPYSTLADVPIEASNLRKMQLPADLEEFLRFSRFRWSVPSFLAPTLAGGSQDFAEFGTELADCIKSTGQDLENNAEDYSKQVNLRESDDFSNFETKKPPKDIEVLITSNSETLLLSEDMYGRKKEGKMIAEDTFADYAGNLERLNLLGEKEQVVTASPTGKSPLMGNIDLDQLNL